MSVILNIIPDWLLVTIAVITCLLSINSGSHRPLVICDRLLAKIKVFHGSPAERLVWSVKFTAQLHKRLSSFLKKIELLLELTSHFQMQYMAINLFTLILFWYNPSSKVWWIVSLAGITINLVEIVHWYLPRTALNENKAAKLRIFQVNILHENKQYAKAIASVVTVQPDIAIFLEISNKWAKELEVLQDYLPYHLKLQDSDNYGSGAAIYSRLPLEEASTHALTGGRKSLVAFIRIEGIPILIIATHLSNPARKRGFQKRNKQLAELGNYVTNATYPVVVAGDFNTTMWSPYYKRFSRQTGLRNARAGFGIMPTWPVRSPLFYIPIDHCLVSRDIQIVKSRTGRNMGSDHLPLITDLAISAKIDRTGNLLSG